MGSFHPQNCVDPRMDWHRVHAILDMVQDDDAIDTLQTYEECDVLQKSEHGSDTEIDLQSDIDDEFADCKTGYRAKDKTVLSKDPKAFRSNVNAKIKNNAELQFKKFKGGEIKHLAQPYDAWHHLFSDDILELIVESTNAVITKKGQENPSETTVEEIKAFFGILYLHGIMRPVYQRRSDLWSEKIGISGIKNTMKLERFNFLLSNLRFECEDDDDGMSQFDTMKRMRKLFEIFAMNCRTLHDIGNVAVVDEVIVPVYGPCPFRYHIDKKQLKSGIKLVLLVDPDNFFICNLDVIIDPYFGPDEIVKKLVQHLAGRGKTIVMDSWYTSLGLIESLKKEYQLYSIAALNSDSEIIPPIFLSKLRHRGVFMTGFLDSESCLSSVVNSESKSVNILTNNPKYYKKSHVNHATSVSAYKKNQSAVEVVDVLMHYYTTMQYSNDWTMSILFTLLNIASVNAQVLWSEQSRSTNLIQRRVFIRELAFGLIAESYRRVDQSTKAVDSSLEPKYCLVERSLLHCADEGSRKRCNICAIYYKRRNRKTKFRCLKCRQYMCKEHAGSVCLMCCD